MKIFQTWGFSPPSPLCSGDELLSRGCSTIAPGGLNGRIRNENGCCPSGFITRTEWWLCGNFTQTHTVSVMQTFTLMCYCVQTSIFDFLCYYKKHEQFGIKPIIILRQ